MLTVKWIYEVDGGEITRIFTAEDVAVGFRDHGQKLSASDPMRIGAREVHRSLCVLEPATLEKQSFDHGTIYVMNDAGATVGKYFLGKSPQE
jgi:hypothetical protein